MARDPEKAARRIELRARRRGLAASRDVAADGPRLADHVLGLLDELGLRAGSVVTSYVALPGEPPTAPLNAALAAHGIRVLVPITLPDFDLDWCATPRPPRHRRRRRRRRHRSGRMPWPSPTSCSPRASRSTAPGPGWARAAGATTGRCRAAGPAPPVVVVLHPGELLDPHEPVLPRQAHDQPVDAVVTAEGVVDLGLSPWRSTPPGAG